MAQYPSASHPGLHDVVLGLSLAYLFRVFKGVQYPRP
jgi:hypothetical protein